MFRQLQLALLLFDHLSGNSVNISIWEISKTNIDYDAPAIAVKSIIEKEIRKLPNYLLSPRSESFYKEPMHKL